MAGIEKPFLRWNRPANRPALRSLAQLYHVLRQSLEDMAESQGLFEMLLALNPDDSHGLRGPVINDFLRQGQDEKAVHLAERFSDDILVETRYGLVLAHYRLDHLRNSQEAAEKTVAEFPLVARYLVRERVRQPRLSSWDIQPGGENQAWNYREEMREVWKNSQGALEWLGKIMKILGVRR